MHLSRAVLVIEKLSTFRPFSRFRISSIYVSGDAIAGEIEQHHFLGGYKISCMYHM